MIPFCGEDWYSVNAFTHNTQKNAKEKNIIYQTSIGSFAQNVDKNNWLRLNQPVNERDIHDINCWTSSVVILPEEKKEVVSSLKI